MHDNKKLTISINKSSHTKVTVNIIKFKIGGLFYLKLCAWCKVKLCLGNKENKLKVIHALWYTGYKVSGKERKN